MARRQEVVGGLGGRLERAYHGLSTLSQLRYIWIALVAAAAAGYLATHWNELVSHRFDLRAIVSAYVLTIIGKTFASQQVRFALARMGVRLRVMPSVYAYSMADAAKYIPGGIWSVVGRVALYRALRLPMRIIAQSLVIEQIWYIGSAASLGIGLYGIARWGYATSWPGSLVVCGGAMLLWGCVVHRMSWAKSASEVRATASILVFQCSQWLLFGMAFAVLLPGEVSFPAGAGAFLLAFAVGMIVPFAPGGIGVREAAAIFLMIPFQSAGSVGYELLLSRAVWVLADLTFAAAVLLFCRNAWKLAVDSAGGVAL